jgi:hypothetical protein
MTIRKYDIIAITMGCFTMIFSKDDVIDVVNDLGE